MYHFRLRRCKHAPHLNFYLCTQDELDGLFKAFELVLFFEFDTLDERVRSAYTKIWNKRMPRQLAEVFDPGDMYMVVPLRISTGIDWEKALNLTEGPPTPDDFHKKDFLPSAPFRTYITQQQGRGVQGAGDPRELYGGQLPLLDPDKDLGLEWASMPGEIKGLRTNQYAHYDSERWNSKQDREGNVHWPIEAFPDTAYFAGRAHEEPLPVCMLCPNVGNLRQEDGCYPGCSQCSKNLALVQGRSFGATLRKIAAKHYEKQAREDV